MSAAALSAGAARAAGPKDVPAPKLRPDTVPPTPKQPYEKMIEQARLDGKTSFLVMDANSGEVLQEHQSHSGLPPASVVKALTALYAMDVLGGDHVFETKVFGTGYLDGEVLNGDLILVGVQGDLGAQVGRVHHAHVLLRRAQVAGILEGHPGVAGLEQHAEHLAPQVLRLHRLEQLQLARAGHGLVLLVALLEGPAVQVVQVGHVIGREQGPVAVVEDALLDPALERDRESESGIPERRARCERS